jgi:hypothetical protein
MAMILWELPVPSTALEDGGPKLVMFPRREFALRMSYEESDEDRLVTLVFEHVEAFKVTYYHARSTAMLDAYDRLVDLGHTNWLIEISANLDGHGESPIGLLHLMINFDHGPCYETVCRSHRLEIASGVRSEL